MFCTQCGYKNSEGARFCKNCGSALSATDYSSPMGASMDTSYSEASYPAVSPAQNAMGSQAATNNMFIETAVVPESPIVVNPIASQPNPQQANFQQANYQQPTNFQQNQTSIQPTQANIQQPVLQQTGYQQTNTQSATSNLNQVLRQAEEASTAYSNLVRQFCELIQQFRNNAITADIFENAKRQLVASHPDGEKAYGEALHLLARRLLELMHNGNITSDTYNAECKWISSVFPTGGLIVCDAEIEDLRQRKTAGQVSDEVYSIHMMELKTKRDEFAKTAGVSNSGNGGYGSVNTGYGNNNTGAVSNPNDTGSAGYAVLGFFVPIVGLILYLVWKDEKPKCARQAGKGAIIGVVTVVVVYIIYIIAIAAWTSSIMGSLSRYSYYY